MRRTKKRTDDFVITLGQLEENIRALLAAGVSEDMPVGICDHYGELEDDFRGLSLSHDKTFVQLDGCCSKYPEPD